MWASYPCFHLCLGFGAVHPEAMVAPLIYSVGYRAHGGATVAVFFSGLSMHKTEAGKSPCSL